MKSLARNMDAILNANQPTQIPADESVESAKPAELQEGLFTDLKELWTTVMDSLSVLPDIAQAGVIIVLAIACAKLAAWILASLVGRWTKKTKTTLDDQLIELMNRPVFLVVLFIGLAIAARKAGLSPQALSITVALLKTFGILLHAKPTPRGGLGQMGPCLSPLQRFPGLVKYVPFQGFRAPGVIAAHALIGPGLALVVAIVTNALRAVLATPPLAAAHPDHPISTGGAIHNTR